MSYKMEISLPTELWELVKLFFLSKPICVLCVQRVERINSLKPTSSSICFNRKHYEATTNPGQYLCKCTMSPTGSLTFSYVCNLHWALNTPMKVTLGQKSLFFKVREVYGSNVITMRSLRQRIRKILKSDLLRLLCSKKDKTQLADEILRLCNV